MTLRFAREASRELREATQWYEGQQPGLGDRFLEEVWEILELIQQHPAAFPVLQKPAELRIRRALLPRFPYALVFFELEEELRVIAVAHVRRRPGYWLYRIRS